MTKKRKKLHVIDALKPEGNALLEKNNRFTFTDVIGFIQHFSTLENYRISAQIDLFCKVSFGKYFFYHFGLNLRHVISCEIRVLV